MDKPSSSSSEDESDASIDNGTGLTGYTAESSNDEIGKRSLSLRFIVAPEAAVLSVVFACE